MKFILKNIIKIGSLVGLSALTLLAGPMLAVAQDYPNKPITIVVGFAPGGSAGNSALIFAEGVKKYLLQPVLVNFKPGAATAVAADFVLKQPADGYNLFSFGVDICGKLAKDGHMLSFKMEDFIPIGIFEFTPHILVVRKENTPIKTFDEFLDYAKKNPGQLSFGMPGIGSGPHLTAEIMMSKWGIKLNLIPFPGVAQIISTMLGGHLDCTVTTPGSAGDHINPGGGLRTIMIFDTQRWPDLPDVLTSLEKGYDIKRRAWHGLAAPKGTPQPVLNILLEAFKKTANDPQMKANLFRLGFLATPFDPEEMKKTAKEEFDLAKEVYKRVDAK